MLQLTVSMNHEAIQRSGYMVPIATSLATEKISVAIQLATQLHES
jgi:hypothetical protein